MKHNIARFFVHHMRVYLKIVPWDYDFTNEEFDGLFISNGPGESLRGGVPQLICLMHALNDTMEGGRADCRVAHCWCEFSVVEPPPRQATQFSIHRHDCMDS